MYPKHLKQYMTHNRCSNKYLLNEFLGRGNLSLLLVSLGERKGKSILERRKQVQRRSKLFVKVYVHLEFSSCLISNPAYYMSSSAMITYLHFIECVVSHLRLFIPSAWITFSTGSPIIFLQSVNFFVFSTICSSFHFSSFYMFAPGPQHCIGLAHI